MELQAGKAVNIAASTVLAGGDLTIGGQRVAIESAANEYRSKESHEIKQTGLSVSLGGETVRAVEKIAAPLQRSGQVQDERLKALYAKQAAEALEAGKGTLTEALRGKDVKGAGLGLNISLGGSRSESKAEESIQLAQGSELRAGGKLEISAGKGDLNIAGSRLSGQDIHLQAEGNINLEAAANEDRRTETNQSSGWNIGVDLGFGGINNIGLSASQSQGHSKGDETTHQLTEISAQNKLTLESGQDTALLGAQLKGETVALNVGQNLKIESLQDESRYEEKNNSSGIGINFGIGGGKLIKPSISGAASKSEIDASYHGVTEQSGIFAGSGGFAIEVGKDTALKGGVIASEATPGKNKLSTETLHVEDIHNETEYEGDSKGIGVQTGPGTKYNEQGITPSIGVKAEGEAESETKAAIAPGTIEIRSDQDKDLAGLNRDTKNALNRLGEIFDKTKVEEQQELAEQFGKAAFAEVHKLGEKMGWKEGGPEKIALHAAVGAIMAKLGGAEALAGATGAAVNEAMINEIAKIKDPALAQWVSYAIGAAAAKAAGGNKQSGGSAAASGTKNNFFHYFMPDTIKNLDLSVLHDNEYYTITGTIRGITVGCIVGKNEVVYDVYGLDAIGLKGGGMNPLKLSEAFEFGKVTTGTMINFNGKYGDDKYSQEVSSYLTGPSISGGIQVPIISGSFGVGSSGFSFDLGLSLSVPDRPSGSFGVTYVKEIGNRNEEETWQLKEEDITYGGN